MGFTNEEDTAILLAYEGFTNGDTAYVLDLLHHRGYTSCVNGDSLYHTDR